MFMHVLEIGNILRINIKTKYYRRVNQYLHASDIYIKLAK